MPIKIDDLEIFITTHNRSKYLKEAIESILNQTVCVKEITVLDNESTDDTENVVNSFASKGIKYIKTQGFLGNFNKAREIASKKYVMLFHDDDLMHPQYLETVLNILNSNEDVSIVTSRFTEFDDDSMPTFNADLPLIYSLFQNQKDFAIRMYLLENIAYAPAVYRTCDFLNIELEYEKYNKFNDWPFMVKMSGFGKSAVIESKSAFGARRHILQDGYTKTNTPNGEQIVNWDLFFYDKMQARKHFSLGDIVFCAKYSKFIEDKYSGTSLKKINN